MTHETVTDEATGRRFHLDSPEDQARTDLTFVLNIHGGGSAGVWQRNYFPAHELTDQYGLVVAAPTAATAEPMRVWVPEVDDEHLQNVVEIVMSRFGPRLRGFWLAGHSQGGMTSHRLLRTPYFGDRVDGFLSLSGGRIGRAEIAPGFGPPRTEEERARMAGFMRRRFTPPAGLPEADFSFIYAVGEHEIVALPETSPWAEKYGAKSRARLRDVVDSEPGKVHDGRWDGRATKGWGRRARPGTARVYVFPDARDGRVIADVVRLDKGHTEGLEPRITEELVKLMVSAPGGKLGLRV